MIVSNSGYSVVSAVVAAMVVVGAGAYQRVLGRLGVEVVGAGRDHRGGVQGDEGARRSSRLKTHRQQCMIRSDWKSQVIQCFGFCSADLYAKEDHKSAVPKTTNISCAKNHKHQL